MVFPGNCLLRAPLLSGGMNFGEGYIPKYDPRCVDVAVPGTDRSLDVKYAILRVQSDERQTNTILYANNVNFGSRLFVARIDKRFFFFHCRQPFIIMYVYSNNNKNVSKENEQ